MKKLKHALCFLLVTAMLPLQTFAADSIKPGPGNNSGENGAVTANGKFDSGDNAAGLYLHVESTGIPVKQTMNADGSPGEVLGNKENVAYWTTHFPNTNPNSTKRNGFYILPGASSKYGVPAAIQQTSGSTPNRHFSLTGQYSWMMSANATPVNKFGKDAWTAIQSGTTNKHNPSPRLPSDYWRKAITATGKDYCSGLLASMFTAQSKEKGIETTADIQAIIKRTDYYLGTAPGSANMPDSKDKSGLDIAMFMNYCGFLATVIRVMPDDERDSLAKQLDTMCQDYFNGSYTPMCVTAEIVIPSEFNGDKKYGQNFWTMQQALYHTQDVQWPDSGITWDQINAKKTGSGKSPAGYKLTGRNAGGGLQQYNHGGKTIRWYGDLIHSIDEGILTANGITNKPIKGYGVFGLTSALASTPPPPPPPTSEATLTAMGKVGLLVEEKKYEKEPGDYTETFKTTITVNLGSSMVSETSSAGDTSNGAGFANVLKWLAQKRAEGQNFPNPAITVYLGQADAVEALDGDKASQLIDRTYGYFGDGTTLTLNSKGQQVSSNQEEERIGKPFTWNNVPLTLGGNVVLKDAGMPGVKVTTEESGIRFEIIDLVAAYNYFQKNSDTLVLIGEIEGEGNLRDGKSKNQHWFKVGGEIDMYGPKSTNDMSVLTAVNTNLRCEPKYDYSTITSYPDDQPYFYSRYQQPFSEFKQGTVPTTGTGSSEKFNSMAGTPTFTEVRDREDFKGTPYEGKGQYYQYFASGGSEFVVQFDGEYVESATGTRNYKAEYTPVACEKNNGSCHTESKPDGGSRHVEDQAHCSHNYHNVSDTFTWTQAVQGFSYVRIKNLKVWKLSEARLDGTRELLDTEEVKATVQTAEPSVFYNKAEANTSADGRLVYSYHPAEKDNALVISKPSDNSHTNHKQNNANDLKGYLNDTVSATCISDFIVLRTSNGDQSILYYEYKSKNAPKIGKVNGTSVSADPIIFDTVPYATIWTGNSQTSKGGNITEDGVTYGGYNGDFSSMGTKYKSSGSAQNISLESTTAYKNESGAFKTKVAPTKKLRLLNDKLVIPDNKQNGEYILGDAEVFYENIININTSEQPNYPIVAQPDFGGKKGFTVKSTYSPAHDKINDVVVYNPVSNQNAMIVSLPEERDQRIKHSATGSVVPTKPQVSGDYTASCVEKVHIHTEGCYQKMAGGTPTTKLGFGDGSRNTIEGGYATADVYLGDNPAVSATGFNGTGNINLAQLNTDKLKDYNPQQLNKCNGGYAAPNRDQYTTTPGSPQRMYAGGNNVEIKTDISNKLLVIGLHAGNLTETARYEGLSLTFNGAKYTVLDAVEAGFVEPFVAVESSSNPRYTMEDPLRILSGGKTGKNNWAHVAVYLNIKDVSPTNIYCKTNIDSQPGDGFRVWAYDTVLHLGQTTSTPRYPKAILMCDDPHHTHSYNWRLYTYGLEHEAGTICSGRGCADTSPVIFPNGEHYTLDQCANGRIVRHANGDTHLTASIIGEVCTYCGKPYKEILSVAEGVDRVPAASEWTHYTYGDTRCWKQSDETPGYVTEIVDGGKTYKMGKFINLDYGFQLYFPNTGDFKGTGARWSSTTSGERGAGYVDAMDTTEWVKSKWVEFPFAVLYNNATYLPNERIYLEVPKKLFDFYVPLQDSEIAQAEIKFGTVAINTQNGETLECGDNVDHNVELITYAGKDLARHHNADKRSVIDVVGRIGNMTLEDTGDFRFANFFKMPVSGWLVENIVRKTDPTKQKNLLVDQTDVRGILVAETGVGADTYGTKNEKRDMSKLFPFPLTPAKNNIAALQRQPIRLGYDSFFDLTTLGNYYGMTKYEEDDVTVAGQDLVLIKPHYYRLDMDTGESKPVDVYMDVNGNKVLVNDFDSNTVNYKGADANVSLNWRDEAARRNYSGKEVEYTEAVKSMFPWIITPSGSTWTYGNYNLLNLTDRNRTFIGYEDTYGYDKDPSERLVDTAASLQGARWHFNVGLPSSSVFVYSGAEPSQANIDLCKSGSAVVYCALEIYAQGEVWTLVYDGKHINQPFTVIPGGKSYDPAPKYPDGKGKGGEEMPIVTIYSIDKSSKLDLDTSGTH